MTSNLGNKEIMARNIRKHMEQNKIERKDFAEMVDAPYTTVCDWVNAKTYPRIDKIEKMAMIFGISKADLVEEKPAINEDDELTKDEKDFIAKIRQLTPDKRRLVEQLALTLQDNQ